MSILSELQEHIRANGISLSSFELNGKIQRDKKHDSAWLIGWLNRTESGKEFIVALYGDWSQGIVHKFRSDIPLTPDEESSVKKQIKKAQDAEAQEKKHRQSSVSLLAAESFSSLPETGEPTAYMQRKKLVSLFGARVSGETLVVPVVDAEGKIWSLQKITDQEKRFLPGGKVHGNFHIIGEAKDSVYICEGFATGCSIHEATGQAVVVAFYASNLLPVARAIRGLAVGMPITIAGDDDKFKGDKNAGREAALEAAMAIGAHAVFPRFKDESSKPTDFNDLHLLEGLEAVRESLVPRAPQVKEAVDLKKVTKAEWFAALPDWKWSQGSGNSPPQPLHPKSSIDNVQALIQFINADIRYDVISKQEIVRMPGTSYSTDNAANAFLARIMSIQNQIEMPTGLVKEFLNEISDRHRFNPVADWIESKPWDGVSRLEDIYATITARAEASKPEVMELKKALMKRWLLSAVAAAYSPDGLAAQGVLVLQGAQGIGKTSWLMSLAPASLDVLAEGRYIKPDDKDSVNQAIRYWIVELGELDAMFKKSDIAQLKAFITRKTDVFRRAYAPKDSSFARRTVFFASVNPKVFLHDETGNRRFWTIQCESVNFKHKVDMQQLWAEVRMLHAQGEQWWLTPDEMTLLEKSNADFEAPNLSLEIMRDWDIRVARLFSNQANIDTRGKKTLTYDQVADVVNDLCKVHGLKPKGLMTIVKDAGRSKRMNTGMVYFSHMVNPPHVQSVVTQDEVTDHQNQSNTQSFTTQVSKFVKKIEYGER